MTADELRKASTAFERASAKTETARETRNRLVLEALAAGWSLGKIAAATGLSRGRIAQLKR
jgi:DNA-binding NarL/FixJ family response regulator